MITETESIAMLQILDQVMLVQNQSILFISSILQTLAAAFPVFLLTCGAKIIPYCEKSMNFLRTHVPSDSLQPIDEELSYSFSICFARMCLYGNKWLVPGTQVLIEFYEKLSPILIEKEDKEQMLEGLMSVLCHLPSKDITNVLQVMITSAGKRIENSLAKGDVDHVTTELDLITCLFSDKFRQENEALMCPIFPSKTIVEMCQVLLSTLHDIEDVVMSVSGLFKKLILTERAFVKEHVPKVATMMTICFKTDGFPVCLTVISTVSGS
jgi:hypothetical protein